MKKCMYCTAEMEDNETKCSYCGKEQEKPENEIISNQIIEEHHSAYYLEARKFKKSKVVFYFLLVTIIMCIVSCFLPYFSVNGFTQNYVLSGKKVLDGVFVIFFGILSIVFLVLKKRVPVLIYQLLALAVFIYDYMYQQSTDYSQVISKYYGVGFYLLLIFLIFSILLSIVRIVQKDTIE